MQIKNLTHHWPQRTQKGKNTDDSKEMSVILKTMPESVFNQPKIILEINGPHDFFLNSSPPILHITNFDTTPQDYERINDEVPTVYAFFSMVGL